MIGVVTVDGQLLAGHRGFNLYSALDVIALCGLAFSLLNAHVWAGYALVVYGAVDCVLKLLNFGQAGWILPVIAYLGGTVVLQGSPSAISPHPAVVGWRAALGWAALWTAGNFAVAFTFGFMGLIKGGVPITSTVGLAHNSLGMVWSIGLAYVVARRSAWPVEAILLVAVASVPFNIIDVLSSGFKPAQFVTSALWWLAAGFIGIGIAQVLRRVGRISVAPPAR